MKRYLFISVLVLLTLAVSANLSAAEPKLQKRIDSAVIIVNEFTAIPESSIPEDVLKNCKGLAIIPQFKGGFIIGVEGGGGIVLAKDATGNWTAPSAISMGGASIGFQIGAQKNDFVLVLNTKAAVDAFSTGNVKLGADASVAAGPVGRTAQVDATIASAVYTYSRSKGLFAGVSLEGAIVNEDTDINAAFYDKPVTAKELLSGAVPPPASAQALYDALSKYSVPKAEPVTK